MAKDDPDLGTWLERPENKGKSAWLAEQLGCTKAAVSFWKDDGVPLARIPDVARLTGLSEAAMLRHAMDRKVAKAAEARAPASAPGALDPAEAA